MVYTQILKPGKRGREGGILVAHLTAHSFGMCEPLANTAALAAGKAHLPAGHSSSEWKDYPLSPHPKQCSVSVWKGLCPVQGENPKPAVPVGIRDPMDG